MQAFEGSNIPYFDGSVGGGCCHVVAAAVHGYRADRLLVDQHLSTRLLQQFTDSSLNVLDSHFKTSNRILQPLKKTDNMHPDVWDEQIQPSSPNTFVYK